MGADGQTPWAVGAVLAEGVRVDSHPERLAQLCAAADGGCVVGLTALVALGQQARSCSPRACPLRGHWRVLERVGGSGDRTQVGPVLERVSERAPGSGKMSRWRQNSVSCFY